MTVDVFGCIKSQEMEKSEGSARDLGFQFFKAVTTIIIININNLNINHPNEAAEINKTVFIWRGLYMEGVRENNCVVVTKITQMCVFNWGLFTKL